MKKIISIFLLCIISLSLLTACEPEDPSTVESESPTVLTDEEIYKVSVDVKKKDRVIYLKDYKKYFYEKVKINYNEGLKVVLGKNSEVIVNDGSSKIIVRINRIGG